MTDLDNFDEEVSQLYREEAHAVRGYLIGLPTDPHLATQFTDDAFLILRRRWHDIRTSERPIAFVYKVASHLRARYYQRITELPSAGLSELATEDPRSDDICSRTAEKLDLIAALNKLPRRERQVALLRYVSRLPVVEVAYVLGVSTGAVKRYASDALKHLAESLGEAHLDRKDRDE